MEQTSGRDVIRITLHPPRTLCKTKQKKTIKCYIAFMCDGGDRLNDKVKVSSSTEPGEERERRRHGAGKVKDNISLVVCIC